MSACITFIPNILLQLTEFCKLTVILLKEYPPDQNSVQNAVPSILPGCPTYLSSEPSPRPTRFVRESKDEELFAQALKLTIEQQAHDTEKYGVHNFSNLLTHISSISLSNKWMAFRSGSELHILMPKLQGHTISIEMRLLAAKI